MKVLSVNKVLTSTTNYVYDFFFNFEQTSEISNIAVVKMHGTCRCKVLNMAHISFTFFVTNNNTPTHRTNRGLTKASNKTVRMKHVTT